MSIRFPRPFHPISRHGGAFFGANLRGMTPTPCDEGQNCALLSRQDDDARHGMGIDCIVLTNSLRLPCSYPIDANANGRPHLCELDRCMNVLMLVEQDRWTMGGSQFRRALSPGNGPCFLRDLLKLNDVSEFFSF